MESQRPLTLSHTCVYSHDACNVVFQIFIIHRRFITPSFMDVVLFLYSSTIQKANFLFFCTLMFSGMFSMHIDFHTYLYSRSGMFRRNIFLHSNHIFIKQKPQMDTYHNFNFIHSYHQLVGLWIRTKEHITHC